MILRIMGFACYRVTNFPKNITFLLLVYDVFLFVNNLLNCYSTNIRYTSSMELVSEQKYASSGEAAYESIIRCALNVILRL